MNILRVNGFQNFLINDFFDYNKMENGQFQLIKMDMDLEDAINEVIDLSMLNA